VGDRRASVSGGSDELGKQLDPASECASRRQLQSPPPRRAQQRRPASQQAAEGGREQAVAAAPGPERRPLVAYPTLHPPPFAVARGTYG